MIFGYKGVMQIPAKFCISYREEIKIKCRERVAERFELV